METIIVNPELFLSIGQYYNNVKSIAVKAQAMNWKVVEQWYMFTDVLKAQKKVVELLSTHDCQVEVKLTL